MFANGDVGVSSAGDSDVEGADAPVPAANAAAPLVDIIEADASGTPHSQMYTTLLDKDGKVVDTNDPHRAIDQRYKSVEQGGGRCWPLKGRQRDGSFSDGCRDAEQR